MQQPDPQDLDWPSFDGEPFDPDNQIKFDPVPRLRRRRRGWSEERQRWFIFVLSRCGSVARAAKACGMTPRSAYALLDAPGADSFAAAWDRAFDEGFERVRADAMQRALGGAFVPVFRRGKLVRVEHRRCDRLALALLSGKDTNVQYHLRVTAVSRRQHRLELKAHDEKLRAEAEARAAAAEAYRRDLEALLERGEERRRSILPRITLL